MNILDIVTGSETLSQEPPASREAIDVSANTLGLKFPQEYVEFLLISNGAEGFTTSEDPGYFRLYNIEKLCERNFGQEIPQRFPGYLLIGSDGGEVMFLVNTTEDLPQPVLMVPFIGDGLNDAEKIGDSFTDFLKRIAN
jgi:hypothetical protein